MIRRLDYMNMAVHLPFIKVVLQSLPNPPDVVIYLMRESTIVSQKRKSDHLNEFYGYKMTTDYEFRGRRRSANDFVNILGLK